MTVSNEATKKYSPITETQEPLKNNLFKIPIVTWRSRLKEIANEVVEIGQPNLKHSLVRVLLRG